MGFAITRHGDTLVVSLGPGLTADNRQLFKECVTEELEKGATNFLFDFQHADYLDSSGLGVLVSLSNRIGAAGGHLRLANLNEDLMALFKLTRLDTLFSIQEGLADDDAGAGRPVREPPPPPSLVRGLNEAEPRDRPPPA